MEIKKTYVSQINNFKHIITNTLVSLNYKKELQILTGNHYNKSILILNSAYAELDSIEDSIHVNTKLPNKIFTNKLQDINNRLSKLIKSVGCKYLADLIEICLGKQYLLEIQTNYKYDILQEFGIPMKYTVIDNKAQDIEKDKIYTNYSQVKSMENCTCINILNGGNNFHVDVHGIDLILKHKQSTLVVTLLIDNINPSCLNNEYIKKKYNLILNEKPLTDEYTNEKFNMFIQSLHLKDYLIYSNLEIYTKYIKVLESLALYKQYPLNKLSKDFLSKSLKEKRTILITLLYDDNIESQFQSYLLYDLLSNENDNNVDGFVQTMLYNSLPWNIKLLFKEAIKNTLDYNKKLLNFDTNTIPLEQQICLMKTNDVVKEKAYAKLKEIKSKSEDSGTKAKTYLDMLLKIPFGIYTEEEILKVNKKNKILFLEILKDMNITIDDNINHLIISSYIDVISQFLLDLKTTILSVEKKNIEKSKKKALLKLSTQYGNSTDISKHKVIDIKNILTSFISSNFDTMALSTDQYNLYKTIHNKKNMLIKHNTYIFDYLVTCEKQLDSSVYGHRLAKQQLLRMLGQWINGENNGYSFGFEGPPGVGKTSLAKLGLAECLKDSDGKSRPFAFIAIGGDANASTLAGHNYTYVGSNPGRLVEIIIETETLNPIIFIDELDKISKTEQGKEIIGILTHLIDPSQNSHYQDKYFSGIDIDMSKVLFIFSYNDVENIDRILLDRIHRVQFEHLNIYEKKIIVRNYILPEVTKIMGLLNMIHIDDDVIEYLIQTYTSESGVRKLKELVFEIVGEINLNILKKVSYEIPIVITIDDITYKYLKHRTPITITKVYNENREGLVNGLWANALGRGGILHIECKLTLGQNLLDLKLTGSLGDVMKESVGVAKTLAWSLLTEKEQRELVKYFDETKTQCIHLHAPEGATPKDGPSAGTAITVAIYSLLSKQPVKQNIAITGEIDLNGNVTVIGGLELKILGGIDAGVNEFIYPDKNQDDFKKIIKKYEDKPIFDKIKFHNVCHIDDVLKIILV